jgi:hypothetical protein
MSRHVTQSPPVAAIDACILVYLVGQVVPPAAPMPEKRFTNTFEEGSPAELASGFFVGQGD